MKEWNEYPCVLHLDSGVADSLTLLLCNLFLYCLEVSNIMTLIPNYFNRLLSVIRTIFYIAILTRNKTISQFFPISRLQYPELSQESYFQPFSPQNMILSRFSHSICYISFDLFSLTFSSMIQTFEESSRVYYILVIVFSWVCFVHPSISNISYKLEARHFSILNHFCVNRMSYMGILQCGCFIAQNLISFNLLIKEHDFFQQV